MHLPPASIDPHDQDHRLELRRSAIARREALTETARGALTARLTAHLDELLAQLAPERLAFCWPYRGEPDLRDWVRHWIHSGPQRSAALPVVLDKHKPLAFRLWTPGMQLAVDRHGIAHPSSGAWIVPDAVLVPLNAYDLQGYRLGYGGGYFDRTLAAIDPVAIGVGFDLGRVDSVFPQAHDRPMDWIVTESGVVRTMRSGT